MNRRHLISAAAFVLAIPTSTSLLGCNRGDNNDDDEEVGITEGALGEPETRGFVTPSLAPADTQRIFAARYTHLDPGRVIPDNLLYETVAYFDANKAALRNEARVAIVDFAKPSGNKRFFMLDMTSGAVTPRMVAHGSGSDAGNGYANEFSDTDGSHMSSLGFVVTGSTITSPRHGRSLLLFGLSRSNAHMRSREIIIHGASYVNETSSRQGKSWGCFALDQDIKDQVITQLANGALMYANLGKANSGARPGASASPPQEPAAPPPPPAAADGPTCATDGDCNPGNDGAGLYCESGECKPGCHANNQCPGATTCQAGMCR